MKLNFHERLWKLPEINLVSKIKDLVLLQIGSVRIFWPTAFKQTDLPWLYNEIFYDRTKNPSTYDHSNATITNNGWVIDAGASEGFFSHFAFLKGAGIIIAIEPLSELRNALYRSFKKERDEKRFFLETVGLGRRSGLMSLDFDHDHPCNASLEYSSTGNAVVIITIDEIINKYNLSAGGFIKMDIEGAEMDALSGAQNTLKTLKPMLAIAVYHEYQNAEKCARIIKTARKDYQLELRGMYCWHGVKPRPYLLYAW